MRLFDKIYGKFQKKYTVDFRKSGNNYTLTISGKGIGQRLDYAQAVLDSQIASDILPYIPNTELRNEVNTMNQQQIGTGEIYLYPADHDFAHYLYEGEKYVDPITGKGAFYSESYGFWSRPDTQKIPSGEPLQFHKPHYTDHWGEVAFNNHKGTWIRVAGRALNGK